MDVLSVVLVEVGALLSALDMEVSLITDDVDGETLGDNKDGTDDRETLGGNKEGADDKETLGDNKEGADE